MCDSVPSMRYSPFVMYCVYGESGSSLLIESTNSIIWCALMFVYLISFCSPLPPACCCHGDQTETLGTRSCGHSILNVCVRCGGGGGVRDGGGGGGGRGEGQRWTYN